MRPVLTSLAGSIVLLFAFCGLATAATTFSLNEENPGTRVFRVKVNVEVSGKLITPAEMQKSVTLNLKVAGKQQFHERRATGAGRDAQSMRSLRQYSAADARIEVDTDVTSSVLRKDRHLIVARGKRDGIEFYSPHGPLTGAELELLHVPGDSLAAQAMLPAVAVELDKAWQVESWVMQMFAGTEAVLEHKLSCKLVSVSNDVAKVEFDGDLNGATLGAVTKVQVKGHYLFDLKNKYLSRIEFTQAEQRSVGAISPGLDVSAKVVLERTPVEDVGVLTESAVAELPLEADPGFLAVELDLPWSVRVHHDRNWHVFHVTDNAAVLRLIEKGSLLAQCNITTAQSALPGSHIADEQFQADIRAALGDRLREIVGAEQLETADKSYKYRVTVVGKSADLEMTWVYYLCADPSGRQTVFVFAFETQFAERLQNRDLSIVSGLEFLPTKSPQPAAAETARKPQ